MRIAVVVLALLIGACTREPAHTVAGPPISMVNPVIGDTSFVVRFGRLPTADDDARLRVQTHLAYAEQLMRARPVAAEKQAARTRALDALHRYWLAGEFPDGEAEAGMLPTFIDDRGVRCAVAVLVEDTAGTDVIHAINRRYRNAWIAQIDAPALASWAAASGFTRDELAIIQPMYPPKKPNIDFKLTTEYRYKVAAEQDYLARGLAPDDDRSHIGLIGAGIRFNRERPRWLGVPTFGLDGSIGTLDGDQLAYTAYARVGSKVSWHPFGNGHPHTMGALAGFGIDRIGTPLWIVPVDTFWYWQVGESMRFGLFAGPRIVVGGADRSLGWSTGVELVNRDVFDSKLWFAPRDLGLKVGVERIADATFVGVTLAMSSRGLDGWYSND